MKTQKSGSKRGLFIKEMKIVQTSILGAVCGQHRSSYRVGERLCFVQSISLVTDMTTYVIVLVIVTRLLDEHVEALRGKQCCELGAGCGLAGLVAGTVASRMVSS